MKLKTAKVKRREKFLGKDNRFKKGNPGRPKGITNYDQKPFLSVKQSVIEAFKDPRIGGTEGLILWVLENPWKRRQVFYNWIMRLLPRTVDIEPASPLDELLSKWKEVTNEDIASKASTLAQEILKQTQNSSKKK